MTSQVQCPWTMACWAVGAAMGLYLFTRLVVGMYHFRRVEVALAGVPRAPGNNWLLGHVIPLLSCASAGKGAWDVMEDWIKGHASPSGLVKYRILNQHGVAFCDPLALKRVFQTGHKLYEKDLALSYKPFLPILGSGLVTADGALWQKQRLLIAPALRTDLLDDIIPIAQRATERLAVKLEALRGTGQPLDLEEEFRLLTLQVIGEAILSMEPEECDRVFPELYLPVMTEANRRVLRPYRMYLPILPAWWQFRARMAKLNDFLITYFRQRLQSREKGVVRARPDLLDRIFDNIKESGTQWDHALEQQMCFEIKTFLLAGHETSAAMLTWSIFELSGSPEAVKQVRAEANAVWGPLRQNQVPPRREVDAMNYTLSVLKEALRKYSVVPVVTRVLTQDDELLGHNVPKGTMIACILQGTHNMYKEPEAFRPERFMPEGEYDQLDENIRLFMFMPFIQGPRNCLGQYMALLEARVVLGLLTQRFTFKPAHEGQGRRHPTVIPIGPVGGMEMTVE